MKVLPVLAALAVVCAAQEALAVGGFMDGNKLERYCRSPDGSYSAGSCLGYVMGVVDAGAVGDAREDGSGEGQYGGFTWCMPAGATGDQAAAVVKKWLADHPESWHHNAASLVAHAVADLFPCK